MNESTFKNLKINHELFRSCIKYIPKGTIYNIESFVKIKQDDGTWVEGVVYFNPEEPSEKYVRTMNQLNKFEPL